MQGTQRIFYFSGSDSFTNYSVIGIGVACTSIRTDSDTSVMSKMMVSLEAQF